MTLTEQLTKKEWLHQAIDSLPDNELTELASFLAFLQFKSQEKDKDWFEKVYDLFEPVRKAIEQSGMSEQEVDQVIDNAIHEVRRER